MKEYILLGLVLVIYLITAISFIILAYLLNKWWLSLFSVLIIAGIKVRHQD